MDSSAALYNLSKCPQMSSSKIEISFYVILNGHRKCWLESSFVGNRPLDTPQTPVIENSFTPRGSSDNTAAPSRMNGVGKSVLV